MNTAYVRVQGVGFDVPIYLQNENWRSASWGGLFLGATLDPAKRRMATLLHGIDFELREGDRLAILGRNGAGKSTLLRILNGVYRPTQGMVDMHGSCQALLNLSLGFNGEATLRENIILRGVAMGMKASFLKQQTEEILDFSGLSEKAHHRLRTLSTGQRLRLGFAISTAMQHDIMLMDEWVGAGDAEFMRKAKERMRNRVNGSKIVVLASHSDGLLRDICNKGLVLEKGRLLHFGDVESAQDAYHGLLAEMKESERQEEAAAVAEPQPESDPGEAGRIGHVAIGTDVVCTIEGWWREIDGVEPKILAVHIDGRRYIAGRVIELAPGDVKDRFPLPRDGRPFRARIRIPHVDPNARFENVKVFVGQDRDNADIPLPLAPEIADTLAKGQGKP